MTSAAHTKPTQRERVLLALQRAGRWGITQVDFLLPDVVDGGPPITRIGARIKELRGEGIEILSTGRRDKCTVYRLKQAAALGGAASPSDPAAPPPHRSLPVAPPDHATSDVPAQCAIFDYEPENEAA